MPFVVILPLSFFFKNIATLTPVFLPTSSTVATAISVLSPPLLNIFSFYLLHIKTKNNEPTYKTCGDILPNQSNM